MSGRLEGKRAIVTGGASGIGRATANRFVHEGAKVCVIDQDRAAGATLLATNDSAASLRFVPADVTIESEIADAVSTVSREWGGLDIVVANAGVQLFGQDDRVDRLDAAVWDRTLRVNLTGLFLTCKYGIRALLASGGGSVVCTASPTGFFGLAPGFDAYSASKAGVFGLTRVMAIDYAREGIRVNAVVPGFTQTPLVEPAMEDAQLLEERLERTPLGRAGTPDEVASAILFLASDEASYSTGSALFVDGGITAV